MKIGIHFTLYSSVYTLHFHIQASTVDKQYSIAIEIDRNTLNLKTL